MPKWIFSPFGIGAYITRVTTGIAEEKGGVFFVVIRIDCLDVGRSLAATAPSSA